jgi:hypothetical protein
MFGLEIFVLAVYDVDLSSRLVRGRVMPNMQLEQHKLASSLAPGQSCRMAGDVETSGDKLLRGR